MTKANTAKKNKKNPQKTFMLELHNGDKVSAKNTYMENTDLFKVDEINIDQINIFSEKSMNNTNIMYFMNIMTSIFR